MWVLDGDTVNNPVPYAKREMQINPEYSIELVKRLSDLKYLKVYLGLPFRPENTKIASRDLCLEFPDKECYVTLTKTDFALQRLRELQIKSY